MLRSQCQNLMRISQGVPRSGYLLEKISLLTQDVEFFHKGGSDQPIRHFSSNDGGDEVREIDNPKVQELAAQIMQLNLLEVSDLTEILRKRLNIQAPSFAMPMGMPVAAGAQAVAADAPSQSAGAAAAEEKTEFTVKLEGFDAAAKIKVIKEVRTITDLGLKEAKDLVEGAPAVLKEGLSKEAAEQLKAKLEAAGAKVLLE